MKNIRFTFLFACLLTGAAAVYAQQPAYIRAHNVGDTVSERLFIGMNSRFAKVFDYMATHRLDTMENGRYEVDGAEIYLNVMEGDLRTPDKANLEVHHKYIDMQIPLTLSETFGYIAAKDCVLPRAEYNSVKDVQNFLDKMSVFTTVQPGQYIVFFPVDGHSPMRGEGRIKKATFKIAVD